MNTLLEMLQPGFVLRNALYGSLLLGAFVPIVGAFLLLGRRTILALALPQVSTLGVAGSVWLATYCGLHWQLRTSGSFTPFVSMLLGALTAIAATLLGFNWLEQRGRTPEDAEIGTLYALAAAMTLALAASNFVPELGLLDSLRGEILALPTTLLWVELIGFGAIGLVLAALRYPLHSILYDRTVAYATGLRTDVLSLLTTVLIAATVALGGLCAGPLTIFAFLVIPPVTFLPCVRHLRSLYLLSTATGVLCAFGGFWISYAIEDWTLPIPAAQISLLGVVWLLTRAHAFVTRKN